MQMRQVLILFAVAGVLAPAALALPTDTKDGSLAVENGRGVITLDLKDAVVFGRVDSGRVLITDPDSDDGTKRVRCDGKRKPLSDTKTRWQGNAIRLRLLGGAWKVTIRGRGIDLSVVGVGTGTIDGSGEGRLGPADGRYSLNDGPYRSLPDEQTAFELGS